MNGWYVSILGTLPSAAKFNLLLVKVQFYRIVTRICSILWIEWHYTFEADWNGIHVMLLVIYGKLAGKLTSKWNSSLVSTDPFRHKRRLCKVSIYFIYSVAMTTYFSADTWLRKTVGMKISFRLHIQEGRVGILLKSFTFLSFTI